MQLQRLILSSELSNEANPDIEVIDGDENCADFQEFQNEDLLEAELEADQGEEEASSTV